MQYCNILSKSIHDVQMQQAESVTVPDCWWDSDPPDDDKVWDYRDDCTLRTSFVFTPPLVFAPEA